MDPTDFIGPPMTHIIMFTGKDGGGTDGTSVLSREVKQLLDGVKGVDTGLSAEIEKVKEALDGSGNLIAKLAGGLQQFIGYNGQSGWIIKHKSNGVGASNDPLERLQDAVLGFLIEVIKRLKDSLKWDSNTGIKNYEGVIDAFENALIREKGRSFGSVLKSDLGVNVNPNPTEVVNKLKQVKRLNKNSVTDLASAFNTYVGSVLEEVKKTASNGSSEVGELKAKLGTLLEHLKSQDAQKPFNFGKDQVDTQQPLKEKLDAVVQANNELSDKLISLAGNKTAHALVLAVYSGTDELLWQLQKGYKSYYQGTPVDTGTWNSNNTEAKICAQIFLGCIPLIYHCLTQLYWLCHETSRGWDKYPFSGGGLRNLMVALGYSDALLGGSTGSTVMTNVASKLSELSTAGKATSKPYPEFLTELTTSFNNAFTSSSNLTDHTIPALYHVAKEFWETKTPSSIREMLYWFSGLQFSPQYDSLHSHISGVFRSLLGMPGTNDDANLSLPVADSSKSSTTPDTLSPTDLKGYLTMTCLYSPMVLGRLQGHGVSTESKEPYLHYLFGNGMSFAYPSGAALLSKLSEYAYALQFQLSFLTQKCSTNFDEGCGWRHCKFGKDLNATGNPVQSHICPGYNCKKNQCQHDGNGQSSVCTHNKGGIGAECGTDGQASPLQAFLTDKLQGFRRGQPGTSDHLDNHPAGSMSHVPMGFTAEYLRETPGLRLPCILPSAILLFR
ncbi:variant erythrocyte surface antigen-1 family protein [Babesia caballi]|uniref:Variant erythrocyte surface antigen-1 family protein n=1 Tax=Babesia caballi TaxID=5871 RepID=A0AAV4LT64_BABCB|nr:variant erythrocyte surface antigen-1 family protein [Babesia caballi]